jgi:hypothetical protein
MNEPARFFHTSHVSARQFVVSGIDELPARMDGERAAPSS